MGRGLKIPNNNTFNVTREKWILPLNLDRYAEVHEAEGIVVQWNIGSWVLAGEQ